MEEIVDFDRTEIAKAVPKAFIAKQSKDGNNAEDIANQVLEIIDQKFPILTEVEYVQEIVEEVLIKNGYASVAKAYIF